MSIDRAVLAFAGAIILISLGLSQLHHPYWLWLTALVVIGALAWLPRGSQASDASAAKAGAAPEVSHAVHASVAAR